MKVSYSDKGVIAEITIYSLLHEHRKLIRCVDEVLLRVGVTARTTGVFRNKTIITGKTSHVMKAYKIIASETKL